MKGVDIIGGYGSGRHNRIKSCINGFVKIDSFYFSKIIKRMKETDKEEYQGSMYWNNGNIIAFNFYQNKIIFAYRAISKEGIENINDTIYFESVPNNYGGAERLYFQCPYCLCQSRFLYMKLKHFKCRKCADLNYKSQQLTKNADMVGYKMMKLIKNKFKVSGNVTLIDAIYFKPECPKGMHRNTYYKLCMQFYRLQYEYGKQFYEKAIRICFSPSKKLNIF